MERNEWILQELEDSDLTRSSIWMSLSTDAFEDRCAPSVYTMACLQSIHNSCCWLPVLRPASVTCFNLSAIDNLL